METPVGQRSAGHGSCPQESHRSGRSTIGGGAVAHPYRSSERGTIRFNYLMVRGEEKGVRAALASNALGNNEIVQSNFGT